MPARSVTVAAVEPVPPARPGVGRGRVARLVATATLTAATLLATAACSTDDSPQPDAPTAATTADTAPAPSESLLPSPTATGSQVGGLVPGFPADLVSPPEGSDILVSSAEPDEATGLTLISLNLRSPLATADLVQAVRDQLVAAGFVETVLDPGPAGLAASSTFVRGDDGAELISLGVLDRDGVRTLTVGGSVRL